MGKYVREAKIGGEAAVVEAAHHQPYLGIRTRAKTLALRRLQESSPEFASSYLQLRSRRLQKHLHVPSSAKSRAAAKNKLGANPSPEISSNQPAGMGENHADSGSVVPVPTRSRCSKKAKTVVGAAVREAFPEEDAGIEASFGDNVLELDTRRSNRETTPCSPIKDSETIGTPGSTTQTTKFTASSRRQASVASSIPTALEMEELFAGPEQLQQRSFVEKYNFDVVKDQPLPGRYEWVKLDY